MGRVFEESFKEMTVDLSYAKGSVVSAAKELDIDSDFLFKWRRDPRFIGRTLVPTNNKLSQEEQEVRELRKRLKDAELKNTILKKTVAIFAGKD